MIELKEIILDPFNNHKSHDLRHPWKGKYYWYPTENSKAKDYRIIYSVEKKIIIYRIAHHSEVYRK